MHAVYPAHGSTLQRGLAAALAVLLFFATSWAACCALACELRHPGGDHQMVACVEALTGHAPHDTGEVSTPASHASYGCHLIGVGLTRKWGAVAPVHGETSRFPEPESRFVSYEPEPLERPPRTSVAAART